MVAPCARSAAQPTYAMRSCSFAHCPVGRWQVWSEPWRAGLLCRDCQHLGRPQPALTAPIPNPTR
jgi:hypothetical protein